VHAGSLLRYRNWEDGRCADTRPVPVGLVDHLAGDRTRNNRVGDTGYAWPRTEGPADQAGVTPNRL
jgi:hypothetical protein